MIPFTPSVKVDKMLFISGQVGIDPATSKLSDASFDAEVKQVMINLGTQLKNNGLGFEDLVSTIVYLKSMKNYAPLNEVYTTFFNGKFPSRTCIAVADLPANASVEISGVAYDKSAK